MTCKNQLTKKEEKSEIRVFKKCGKSSRETAWFLKLSYNVLNNFLPLKIHMGQANHLQLKKVICLSNSTITFANDNLLLYQF